MTLNLLEVRGLGWTQYIWHYWQPICGFICPLQHSMCISPQPSNKKTKCKNSSLKRLRVVWAYIRVVLCPLTYFCQHLFCVLKERAEKKLGKRKRKKMHNNVSKLTNLILICVCVGDTSTKNGLFQENKSQLIIHTAASAFFNPSYHPPKKPRTHTN